MALLVFLGAVGWIFTWPDPAAHAVKKRIMSVFSPFMRTGTAIQENISTLSAPALPCSAGRATNKENRPDEHL